MRPRPAPFRLPAGSAPPKVVHSCSIRNASGNSGVRPQQILVRKGEFLPDRGESLNFLTWDSWPCGLLLRRLACALRRHCDSRPLAGQGRRRVRMNVRQVQRFGATVKQSNQNNNLNKHNKQYTHQGDSFGLVPTARSPLHAVMITLTCLQEGTGPSFDERLMAAAARKRKDHI